MEEGKSGDHSLEEEKRQEVFDFAPQKGPSSTDHGASELGNEHHQLLNSFKGK